MRNAALDPEFVRKMTEFGSMRNRPWAVFNNEGRITIANAYERGMAMIEPAQVVGQVPSLEEKIAIAQFICDAVNAWHDTDTENPTR